MLGSVAAITVVSITIPNNPDILCRLDYRLTAIRLRPTLAAAVAAAGARRISVRNDSKQSRFRIMVASLVRIPYWRDRDTRDASASPLWVACSPAAALSFWRRAATPTSGAR